MEVDAAGAAAAAVASSAPAAAQGDAAMDSDDDWDPVVGPSVVLRPHVFRWTSPQGAGGGDDEDAAGDKAGVANLAADPLHDPAADDEDEMWVSRELLLPDQADRRETAAVLNCPGCFTPVCYQCQRHAECARQWRAVEVRNCVVDRSSALTMAKGESCRYFAVRCGACSADVGPLDEDGVYHLFHVLDTVT